MIFNCLKFRIVRVLLLFFLTLICLGIYGIYYHLEKAKTYPIQAFWVLGGSIQREIQVAKLRQDNPNIPILISQGSQDPCIVLIFEREKINFDNVWLERCGNNTFGNFFYGIPIMEQWKVHKVKLITSGSHVPRAKLMAQIMLSIHGIALDFEIVPEKGVPGNREYPIKTFLDVTRTLFWSPLSLFFSPECNNITLLNEVNMTQWQKKDFSCESQAKLKIINN